MLVDIEPLYLACLLKLLFAALQALIFSFRNIYVSLLRNWSPYGNSCHHLLTLLLFQTCIYVVNGDHQLFDYQHSSKYLLFLFNIKKLIQVRNDMRVNKWWQHFNFWVNYCFNTLLKPSYSLPLHQKQCACAFKLCLLPYYMHKMGW